MSIVDFVFRKSLLGANSQRRLVIFVVVDRWIRRRPILLPRVRCDPVRMADQQQDELQLDLLVASY